MAAPLVSRLTDVRPGEGRVLAWSFLSYFFLLSGYYILRPIREAMGVAGGSENLPWLMQAAVVVMLLINPVFSALASRLPRRRLLPPLYHLVVSNLLAFWALLEFAPESWAVWIGRVFYVWVSVINLFVVSMFWSLAAERFDSEQGKRLFGVVAAGGSLGALCGSGLTALFAELVEQRTLFFPSMLLFECAVLSIGRLIVAPASAAPRNTEHATTRAAEQPDDRPLGGSAWAGFREVVKQPYLLAICLFVLLQTVSATWVYYLQADIIDQWSEDRGAQTGLFAKMDFFTNLFSLLLQLFLAGRITSRLGVGVGLALLPLLSVAGFAGLSLMPVLSVLVVFQVARRSLNYGVAKPAREALFTVLTPEQKYKAKNLTDLALYRGGDALGSEVAKWVSVASMTAAGSALSLGWIGVALGLGVSFRKRAGGRGRAALV